MKEIKQKSKGSQYKCSQVFGYKGSKEKIHEQDLISVLKFDQEGRHIALGDKAGRVIVFKSNAAKKKEERFSYYTEVSISLYQFQAYNRQFDPLNSNDVDQEILQLLWMRDQGQYQKMLTMNCKNIKLWKIFQRAEKKIVKTVGRQLSFPKFQQVESSVNSILQKTIHTKFEEELIGMDQTNNEQYIICSDLVKTVLWNLDKSGTPYLVADIQKNKKIQDCKENINCIKAHPTTDSMFAYGTNYGTVVLGDCRISDSCQPLTLKIDFSKEKNNFFSQMISSCSGLAFTNNSRQIVVRDYLSVKLWDLSKTDKPLLSIPVQQSLKTKLCDIFQNNCIFDKFSLSLSRDGATALTGNYNNCFHAIDLEDSTNTQYQVSFKKQTINRPMLPNKCPPITKMDYARKVIASDFHPKSNSFAISSLNCFLIYSM